MRIRNPGQRGGGREVRNRVFLEGTVQYSVLYKRHTYVKQDSEFWNSLCHLKVHKIEIFFGFDFQICIISLLVM
jgi:hypothetical protein